MNEIEKDILSQIAINDNANNTLKIIVFKHIDNIFQRLTGVIKGKLVQFIASWVLEKSLWIDIEEGLIPTEKDILSRGRAIMINPGVSGIGREQKYPHVYIVLGETDDTFIGVPLTNMAFDKKTHKYYLRNFYEVELKNPTYEKPFNQFRCNKPTVADVRNICGFDKRRIMKTQLYTDKKFVPEEYLNAISDKIRKSLAIIINLKNNEKDIDVS